MNIAIASDHGGFELKLVLIDEIKKRGHDVIDMGCDSPSSCDYPDYAKKVALSISAGESDQGVLLCKTGMGMSMAANRYAGIRAALCSSPEAAELARAHNNANVLVLGGGVLSRAEALAILAKWFSEEFSSEERHARRVDKIESISDPLRDVDAVHASDPEIHKAVSCHILRQSRTLNLIASENYVSPAVRQAQGSSMTNKYAEGYPGKRYYNGCECVDIAESLAIERAKKLFGADHANVQPHCGSSANMAVYFSVLEPGDKILGMKLDHGGHLTHGHKLNFSGRLFKFADYGVEQETEIIDYDKVEKIAQDVMPKLIVVGASAYPRFLDFERFRAIADKVGAMLMVDMAHIAGLIAAGVHPDPVPYADFVTSTTHKTLRGPRGGLVLCKEKYAKALDKTVFPGLQGGPLMHTIASKAVCFLEAMRPEFKEYGQQIVKNAAALANVFAEEGLRIVSGGTDNHIVLIDVGSVGATGNDAAEALERSGMIANKNAIPFDKNPPVTTSGVRIGTPALTTRGMKEAEMRELGSLIVKVVKNVGDSAVENEVMATVRKMADRFPIP